MYGLYSRAAYDGARTVYIVVYYRHGSVSYSTACMSTSKAGRSLYGEGHDPPVLLLLWRRGGTVARQGGAGMVAATTSTGPSESLKIRVCQ